MEITIEKTQIELYKLRGSNGCFANITVDHKDKTGRISISSDFGNWSYYWGSCGSDFKQFLIGLEIGYAADKFGEGRWFDYEATMKYLKRRIKEYAPEKEDRDTLNRELQMLEGNDDRESFVAWMWKCPQLMEMEDNSPDLHTNISPGFRRFWETLWQKFIAELKSEIATMQPV